MSEYLDSALALQQGATTGGEGSSEEREAGQQGREAGQPGREGSAQEGQVPLLP